MRSSVDGSSVSNPPSLPNAFTAAFLRRLLERDESPTGAEADVAGPWRIEEVPGRGFGLFRVGESAARGFEPVALYPSRWLALATAAVLPGTGRDPLLRLRFAAAADGRYDVTLEDGEVVGSFQSFDEKLLDAVNVAIGLLRAPLSLADLMEAAGPVGAERCGTILEERISQIPE